MTEHQTEATGNPYHLVVALVGLMLRENTATITITAAEIRDIATLFPRGFGLAGGIEAGTGNLVVSVDTPDTLDDLVDTTRARLGHPSVSRGQPHQPRRRRPHG